MSDIIASNEDGTVEPESANEVTSSDDAVYSESDEHVPDPTSLTGTMETSETTGVTQSASDVSAVFNTVDEVELAPEGTVEAAQPDPAATGEDALKVTYEGAPPVPGGSEETFDPSAHTVPEVNAHLASADEDERARVLEAETADKNRTTVES
jgi:hypothetical protein